ncbi:MAG TPA: hypothetical protein VHR18_13130 [Solirubrobacterales bacterium]|nr:hypothetical protein [Solirubrobacterales bacterium]
MIPASRALTRLLSAACAAALAALVIALAGCGGNSAATADGTVAAATGTKASAKVEVGAGSKRCQGQVGDFLAAMGLLRERLVAGLSYEQYVAEINQVRASYDEVPVEQMALRCVSNAGTPGERAFGKYIAAANAWGDCIGESGCDAATVEPILQKQWRVAAHFLDEARRGLRA